MKLRKLFLLLPLFSLVCLTDSASQARTRQRKTSPPRPAQKKPANPRPHEATTANNTVEVVLRYEFSVPKETQRIEFFVVVPKTIPHKQTILDVRYSPRPSRIFQNNGNRYAQFVFTEPKSQLKVQINIEAELLRYDLSTARKSHEKSLAKGPDFEDFLKQEKYIEKDNTLIQQIAEGITGQNEIDTVRKIYNYVADNMEYAVQGEKDRGAIEAVQQKKGDCSEYSDLFVAICRAKNIPARFVTGYTVRFDDISPKHHWAEVYLQEYGWVPFDPSWGDVEDAAIRNKMFGTMKPVYIYLSRIRSDDVLHNSHFYTYLYFGDKVTLTDSIEFKQPDNLPQETR
ncbi:MAG TPA: transglutaminase domain-containing protein [Sedimentisphaerales bacterium]|nr:transglutaminase domain-containing protein [Sedimentisphaerales bacterium]